MIAKVGCLILFVIEDNDRLASSFSCHKWFRDMMSGAGMGHSEKLLEMAFNQRRLKAATPKLDDILGSLLLVMVGLL